MALWQVDVEKVLGGEYWTNRYIVADTGPADPVTLAGFLIAGERSFHQSSVLFTKARVATYPESDGEYTIIPINLSGLLTTPNQRMPLFNVFRVDLRLATGRPSRKYYRCPVMEDDQIDGNVLSAKIASLNGLVNDMILDCAGSLVDPQGQVITSASCAAVVGMRQLRRGSKRTPILPS